jgi:hypothetical protein
MFFTDLTPTVPGNVQTETCVWPGGLITADVVTGETYIFSTCGSIETGDTQLTLYYSSGTIVLDYDGCHLFSTIRWVATYTSTAHRLIEEWGANSCEHGMDCYELTVIWELPLPIELLGFDLEVFDNKVQLKWQTTSEINNDFFTIERSIGGINWEAVNKVDGSGNSSSLLGYVSLDEKPSFGISYYRLKQTDFYGNFSFSEIKSANIYKLENQNSLKIYPNTAENKITLTGSETELHQLKICDILGENITALTKFIINNDSKLIIDLSNLNTGMYYIKTKTTTNKVYKQ